ncbi:dermonecrotic toxin domain-containing protein, partial [Pseudomonas syringae group genomosp. 7]|uniref:dermonecrotic toxin domain-containing protein n=1 Tax=Pseudomonas syringae group genomosp. 7 TaxID=251699 RepID=UPI00376FB8D9
VEYRDRNNIKLEQLAEFCHELDLGGPNQTHLDSVFKPAAAEAASAVADAYISSESDAVEMLAHIAMMKRDLTDAAY